MMNNLATHLNSTARADEPCCPLAQSPVLLTIERDDCGYTVRVGELWAYHLTPDEALWQVALLLARPELDRIGYLRSPAQHADWAAKFGPKQITD